MVKCKNLKKLLRFKSSLTSFAVTPKKINLIKMILNKQEILESARPHDERKFMRWIEAKLDQVLKYPVLLPYSLSTRFGRLEVVSRTNITFNDCEVKLEN